MSPSPLLSWMAPPPTRTCTHTRCTHDGPLSVPWAVHGLCCWSSHPPRQVNGSLLERHMVAWIRTPPSPLATRGTPASSVAGRGGAAGWPSGGCRSLASSTLGTFIHHRPDRDFPHLIPSRDAKGQSVHHGRDQRRATRQRARTQLQGDRCRHRDRGTALVLPRPRNQTISTLAYLQWHKTGKSVGLIIWRVENFKVARSWLTIQGSQRPHVFIRWCP